jgi:hypothetical protein
LYRFSCHRRNLKLGIIEQRKFKLLAELGNVRLRPIAILPHVTIVRAVPSPSIARHVTLLHTADGDTASAGNPLVAPSRGFSSRRAIRLYSTDR